MFIQTSERAPGIMSAIIELIRGGAKLAPIMLDMPVVIAGPTVSAMTGPSPAAAILAMGLVTTPNHLLKFNNNFSNN